MPRADDDPEQDTPTDVQSLVEALLAECGVPLEDFVAAQPAFPATVAAPAAAFERRPSWMSQLGKRSSP